MIALVVYWLAMFIGTHIPPNKAVSLGTPTSWCILGAYAGLAILVGLNWRLRRAFGLRQALVVLTALVSWARWMRCRRSRWAGPANSTPADWTADATGVKPAGP